jgi:dipeptidyl aminopeptidase/acylaminoacyl peptidase
MRELKLTILLCAFVSLAASNERTPAEIEARPLVALMKSSERQVTHQRSGHILTNTGAWSPDSEWLVYDTRSDAAGNKFDGNRIEMVKVATGEVKVLYTAKHGAHCGVVTFHPHQNKVVFILGPEHPTSDWQYGAWHRQGVIVDTSRPEAAVNLDARDLTPPFTPGALRGGSHVHVWDAAGEWVSFTYEDHVLAGNTEETAGREINLRNIGVSVPGQRVSVPRTHSRNHDGEYFSVLVTRTKANPEPGSDQINKAFEEGWVGTNGYIRVDGARQRRALAFQGQVLTAKRENISEVFIVDLPEDVTIPGDGPLAGTENLRPFPPKGTVQRRLTFSADRKYAGIQGPRHWLRCSPSGERIAFLMKDEEGVVQLWTVSPNGGLPMQVTRNQWPISSTFTWSPDGTWIAQIMDNSVCVTDATAGVTKRLTQRCEDETAPRPEACVFSPDGRKIAYVRPTPSGNLCFNQIWVVGVEE